MNKQTAKTKTITVKTNEQNPEPLELLAQSIIDLSDAFRRIQDGPLKQYALIVLLQDYTKLAKRDIQKILEAVPNLKRYYLKEIKK